MNEKRKHVRYTTTANIRLAGDDYPAYFLKDISIAGCCIKYPADQAVVFRLNEEYTVTLLPEPEAMVKSFDLKLEPCWIDDKDGFHEAGCFITGFPKGKLYQRFADYLAWRASGS